MQEHLATCLLCISVPYSRVALAEAPRQSLHLWHTQRHSQFSMPYHKQPNPAQARAQPSAAAARCKQDSWP